MRRRTEESIAEEIAHHYGDIVRETVESTRQHMEIHGGPDVDSPIERIMYLAIMMSTEWYGFGSAEYALPHVSFGQHVDEVDVAALPCPAVVAPQYQIGSYRADFIIKTPNARVAIECDGHEFHERTKEQAQRDKARDRFFQSEGWPVLRFTGSEIWADPLRCGTEAVRFITTAEYRARK